MSDQIAIETLKALLQQAAVATENGDFGTARHIATQILDNDTGNLAALHIYFDSTKIEQNDSILNRLSKFCENKSLPNSIQSQLQFMYGKGLSDQGQYERAFHAFNLANQLSGKKANPNATASLSRALINSVKNSDLSPQNSSTKM